MATKQHPEQEIETPHDLRGFQPTNEIATVKRVAKQSPRRQSPANDTAMQQTTANERESFEPGAENPDTNCQSQFGGSKNFDDVVEDFVAVNQAQDRLMEIVIQFSRAKPSSSVSAVATSELRSCKKMKGNEKINTEKSELKLETKPVGKQCKDEIIGDTVNERSTKREPGFGCSVGETAEDLLAVNQPNDKLMKIVNQFSMPGSPTEITAIASHAVGDCENKKGNEEEIRKDKLELMPKAKECNDNEESTKEQSEVGDRRKMGEIFEDAVNINQAHDKLMEIVKQFSTPEPPAEVPTSAPSKSEYTKRKASKETKMSRLLPTGKQCPDKIKVEKASNDKSAKAKTEISDFFGDVVSVNQAHGKLMELVEQFSMSNLSLDSSLCKEVGYTCGKTDNEIQTLRSESLNCSLSPARDIQVTEDIVDGSKAERNRHSVRLVGTKTRMKTRISRMSATSSYQSESSGDDKSPRGSLRANLLKGNSGRRWNKKSTRRLFQLAENQNSLKSTGADLSKVAFSYGHHEKEDSKLENTTTPTLQQNDNSLFVKVGGIKETPTEVGNILDSSISMNGEERDIFQISGYLKNVTPAKTTRGGEELEGSRDYKTYKSEDNSERDYTTESCTESGSESEDELRMDRAAEINFDECMSERKTENQAASSTPKNGQKANSKASFVTCSTDDFFSAISTKLDKAETWKLSPLSSFLCQKKDDKCYDEDIMCSVCGIDTAMAPTGMINCTHCFDKIYCSPDCLHWDWNHGNHAKECEGESASPGHILSATTSGRCETDAVSRALALQSMAKHNNFCGRSTGEAIRQIFIEQEKEKRKKEENNCQHEPSCDRLDFTIHNDGC